MMSKEDGIDIQQPLPPEWLPDPQPPEGHAEWSVRAERVMAAAGPELSKLRGRERASEPSWWPLLGGWLKPTAAFGVAAAVLLVFVETTTSVAGPSAAELTLGIIAAEGDPVALWEAHGVDADPVLALIALEDHGSFARTGSALPGHGEVTR